MKRRDAFVVSILYGSVGIVFIILSLLVFIKLVSTDWYSLVGEVLTGAVWILSLLAGMWLFLQALILWPAKKRGGKS